MRQPAGSRIVSSQEPEQAGKDSNGPPSSPPTVSPASDHAASPVRPSSEPPADDGLTEGKPRLPEELSTSYHYITNTLKTTFPTQPPHTIQRLSELVLHPRHHYRYLPSYLNALDRAVSVSSGSGLFPLPSLDPLSLASTTFANGSLSNGNSSSSASPSPSPVSANAFQDDSLGGALLTPIPWLRANGGHGSSSSASGQGRSSSPLDAEADAMASSSSPLSASSPPGRDNIGGSTDELGSGPVTQGELLRQEQTSGSPPAPVSSLPSRAYLTTAPREEVEAVSAAKAIGDEGIPLYGDGVDEVKSSDAQEQPHARGPDIIGLEDTGKQNPHSTGGQVLDLEAAVGRASSSSEKHAMELREEEESDGGHDEEKSTKRKAEEDGGNDAQKLKKDDSDDTEITDVDGHTQSEDRPADGQVPGAG